MKISVLVRRLLFHRRDGARAPEPIPSDHVELRVVVEPPEAEAAAKQPRDAVEDFEASHYELVETVRNLTRRRIDVDLLDGGSMMEMVNDIITYAADTA